MRGDVVILDAIFARVGHALGPSRAGVEKALGDARATVEAKDLGGAQTPGFSLRAALRTP